MGKSRFCFFTTALLLIAQYCFAQDVIYKLSGDSITAKVKEISQTEIVYKRFDNQEGPEYVILTNAVSKIVYKNGLVEIFNEAAELPVVVEAKVSRVQTEAVPVVYGKNIISFIPVHIIQTVPFGFGIQYERFLGEKQFLAIRVPVSVSFIKSDSRGNYDDDGRRLQDRTGQMFWTYPGVKVYLLKNKRKVSLAVGPNLVFGVGSVPVTKYNGYYNSSSGSKLYEYAWDDKFTVGMMVGGSVNIQPLPKLYMGLDFGLGYSFNDSGTLVSNSSSSSSSSYNNYTYTNDNYLNAPLVQFAFSMGYRF